MDDHLPYLPLTDEERQKKANRLAQKFCTKCPCDYSCGCVDENGKAKCIWYLIMNAMIGEEQF